MTYIHIFAYIVCFVAVVSFAETAQSPSNALISLSRPRGQWSTVGPTKYTAPTPGKPAESLDVLDIVLVASVDGRFHALNRTSGNILWSMDTASTQPAAWSNGSLPTSLGPMIRTSHVDLDPDLTDDDAPHQELYIIEPQSGEIFVMSTPTSPLQRLPFTMMQLVDMSPFSFSGDEERRIFVGRKETSLMLIELETGKLKEINSECPWDVTMEKNRSIADLDELEGIVDPRPSTEVFIGRTDYHVAIHTRPANAYSPKPPVQNLSFSVYGPNNKDLANQMAYKRSADDVYVQSLPNGEVFSFQVPNHDTSASAGLRPIWHSKFSSPIVAAFDVVRSPAASDPFVLLQPRPRIEETVPNVNDLPNRHLGHVGLIGDSLFAITPKTFPLVAFGDSRTNAERDYTSVDDYNEARRLEALCGKGSIDHRCAVGLRHLEDSKSWNRLLDAPATSTTNPSDDSPPTNETVADDHATGNATDAERDSDGIFKSTPRYTILVSLAVAVFTVAFWLFKKTMRPRKVEMAVSQIIGLANGASGNDMVKMVLETSAPIPASGAMLHSHSSRKPVEQAESNVHASTYVTQPPISNGESSQANSAVALADFDDSDADDKKSLEKQRNGKKNRRGGRGKKKKDIVIIDDTLPHKSNGDLAGELVIAPTPNGNLATPTLVLPELPKPSPASTQLIVSESVLGYGSHGTVVYAGSLQGRSVAVKRLLHDFVTLASREVSILQDADDHPNVIRYYYQEAQGNFLYIALELCPASLADVIERPDLYRDISVSFEPKRALAQITAGLRHLHSLKIIHRDIKPQNILISAGPTHRMLISDFGLCKKLDFDQTSFLPTAAEAGTVGWRAPEILRGDVKLDDGLLDDNASSRGETVSGGGSGTATKRLTKLVDIFALGCLFYYVLTNGKHPFGDRYEREVNIMKGSDPCLDGIESERFGEEGAEASALILSMLETEPKSRPDTSACLLHPYFWDSTRRLAFLQDASDRFEIMCRDPREPDLITLEVGARDIVGTDWHARLDRIFVENLGKFRKYDGRSVQDLMRALRNKKHHYQDLPEHVKRHLGPMPEGYLAYFTRRFPKLFLHVHGVVACTALRHEPMFKSYFTLRE